MIFRNYLFNTFRRISIAHGFEEYDSSILEHELLYTIKSGNEICSQLFNFVDKGNRKVTLRPEITPSLTRMILNNNSLLLLLNSNNNNNTIKYFSIPQCWRYEKTTKGRRREHYQWNLDIWGSKSIYCEAELINIIIKTFLSFKLTCKDVGIKINNRNILWCILTCLNIDKNNFHSLCVIIDKIDKLELIEFKKQLNDIIKNNEIVNELINCLNIKNINLLKNKLYSLQYVQDNINNTNNDLNKLINDSFQSIEELFDLLGSNGFNINININNNENENDWLIFDPGIVRGLAYYTGIVFEAFDRSNSLRAICGGGRYDSLATTLHNNNNNQNNNNKINIPAVGFGFGDAVIYELLKMKNLLPKLPSSKSISSKIMIWTLTNNNNNNFNNNDLKKKSLYITNYLRDNTIKNNSLENNYGIECIINTINTNNNDLEKIQLDISKQLKQFLKRANRNESNIVILCTIKDNLENNSFIIKNMKTNTQILWSYNNINQTFINYIENEMK